MCFLQIHDQGRRAPGLFSLVQWALRAGATQLKLSLFLATHEGRGWGPLRDAVSAQKALQGSREHVKKLEEGTKERQILSGQWSDCFTKSKPKKNEFVFKPVDEGSLIVPELDCCPITFWLPEDWSARAGRGVLQIPTGTAKFRPNI